MAGLGCGGTTPPAGIPPHRSSSLTIASRLLLLRAVPLALPSQEGRRCHGNAQCQSLPAWLSSSRMAGRSRALACGAASPPALSGSGKPASRPSPTTRWASDGVTSHTLATWTSGVQMAKIERWYWVQLTQASHCDVTNPDALAVGGPADTYWRQWSSLLHTTSKSSAPRNAPWSAARTNSSGGR